MRQPGFFVSSWPGREEDGKNPAGIHRLSYRGGLRNFQGWLPEQGCDDRTPGIGRDLAHRSCVTGWSESNAPSGFWRTVPVFWNTAL
jgi:hypothetical protein